MERRDWSLRALDDLVRISSLESSDRARSLIGWAEEYLPEDGVLKFDLELEDLQKLSELFYTNIDFLYNHKNQTRLDLLEMNKMRKFLNH